MQFLYHKEASKQIVTIEGEEHKYLFKVRRLKNGSYIELRNLIDNNLYLYKIININKKDATLELLGFEEKAVIPSKKLTIAWCIIDPKNIEKVLPMLNEIGVSKIVFIKCAYSQANFKIKKERLEKILINSCQQCGRTNFIEFEFESSIQSYLNKYPNSYLLNFSNNKLNTQIENINSIAIGCEGGLSKDEIALFSQEKVLGLNTNTILKSESAVVSVASKILL
jgi:16S rRNA (uracil1498-N3)-methyltransferase